MVLRGVDVAFVKSIPEGIQDMSAIIKEAKAANVDAFLCLAYPNENILCVSQSMELGFNPKLMIFGPGVCYTSSVSLGMKEWRVNELGRLERKPRDHGN